MEAPYLIENAEGERQCVDNLTGYEEGWTVIASGPEAHPGDDEALFENGAWAVPLSILKARKWEELKAQREDCRRLGCPTPYGLFDADPVSQMRVEQATRLGTEVTWTLADNSVVVLSHDQIVEVAELFAAFEASLHILSQGLRAAVDKAQSAEELEAIQWTN